jgi:tetratricopeptide (TPR) repeat protein
MAADVNAELLDAKDYAESENYGKAWPIVSKVLNDEPDNPQALCIAAYMMNLQGNAGLGYQLMKRVTTMFPANPTGWLNLGKACDDLWKMEEAEACYRRALNNIKAGDDKTKMLVFNNLSAMYTQMGKYQQGRHYAERALQIDPTHLKARHNVGLSMLAQREWKEGWKQYEASVGSPHRIMFRYGDEPEWKGEKNATVAVYGEQGIGDEICAASVYNDAIRDCKKLVIDCDARLKNIFQRSFPAAKVYGTRSQKVLDWNEEDHHIDYSISAVQLGSLYRNKDEDFPRVPYLVADKEQVFMWKALWASKKKPVVGMAWTGGIKNTAEHARTLTIEQLKPILGIDAHFVNLSYKKCDSPGMATYEHATLSKDYDQTASLVASLDAVIGVPTSVIHLAGALGVPTIAMKSPISCWKYTSGLPFHPCTLVENDGDWGKTINNAARLLRREIGHE